MANIIDVNYSGMQNARKQMLMKVHEYTESTDRVRAVVAELRGQWEGDAQAAFDAEQMAAMLFYEQMARRTSNCANYLARASARYAETDHAAAGLIKAANG